MTGGPDMADGLRVITCHQPTYLPWAGLFHKLALADAIVVMDTVDYSRAGWQNRNRIKGSNGPFWLTVPLARATSVSRRLHEVTLVRGEAGSRSDWQQMHWASLRHSYAHARYWSHYSSQFEEVYLGRRWTHLAELNLFLLKRLASILAIDVEFIRASDIGCQGRKSRLVLDHCRRTSATVYVSGVNGHDYLFEREFLDAGISVFYQGYRSPVYEQRHGAFAPHLSVVDLLFNVGADSTATLLAGNVRREDIARALNERSGPAVLETVAVAGGCGVASREPGS
jgi:hypothetical protein